MPTLMALIVIANVLALLYLLCSISMAMLGIIQKARRREPLQDDALALVAFALAVAGTGLIERTGWPGFVVYYVPFGIILLVFDLVIGTALFAWLMPNPVANALRASSSGTGARMRRLERVEIDGEIEAFMSLVPWGLLRRWLSARKARRTGIKMMFVPKYELAVFRDQPHLVMGQALLFRFRNKTRALEGYHKVTKALREDGYWGDPVRALFNENHREWLGN